LANETNGIYACARWRGGTVQGYFQFYALRELSGPAYRRLRAVTMTEGSESTILTENLIIEVGKKTRVM